MKNFWISVLGLVFLCQGLLAKETLQTGTSVSHFYDARSIFTNPAALAYQKQLNGAGLLSSLSWAWQESQEDFGVGLAWGNWGLGIEKNRYTLATGLALGPYLFGGSRLVFTNATQSSEKTTGVDIGLQIRPAQWFALGLLANSTQYTFGLTLRPMERVLLQADFESPSRGFGSSWHSQAQAVWEPWNGFFLSGGYDTTKKVHLGFQVDLGKTSLVAIGRPEKAERSLISHAQFSFYQKPSSWVNQQALHLRINSELGEQGEARSFFNAGTDSFSELLWKIEQGIAQPSVKTFYVELETFPLGMGAASELHESLWRARTAGKTIHVNLGNARLKEYLIASAAQTITVAPSGAIELIGPKSERYYLKGTLEKLGVEAEMVAKGAYKSAPEMFTQKKASEKSRENIFANLKEAETEIARLIQRSGRVSKESWNKARQLGVLSTQEALKLKLVDQIADSAEAYEQVSSIQQVVDDFKVGTPNQLALKPQIALVVAAGDIVQKRIKWLGVMGSSQITPEQFQEQIEIVQRDPRIKALVVRISSGGGDVLASQLIANQVKALKAKKPVVISMGDVAASGGYFFAAPAETIFADPLTLTGSIGVFSGKPNLSGLYKKIDLQKETLSLAPYPRLYDESQRWSASEREIIQRQVDSYYRSFIEFVAAQRKLEVSQVETRAQGRVWLGRKAQELKLVDALGGPVEALKKAQTLAGLADFELKVIHPTVPFFEALNPLASVSQGVGTVLQDLKPALLSDQPLLYWSGESLQ